jgi:hypothetical protein
LRRYESRHSRVAVPIERAQGRLEVRNFAMLSGMFEDDEPYMPYALAMAGLSVAVFLSLVGGWLIR